MTHPNSSSIFLHAFFESQIERKGKNDTFRLIHKIETLSTNWNLFIKNSLVFEYPWHTC